MKDIKYYYFYSFYLALWLVKCVAQRSLVEMNEWIEPITISARHPFFHFHLIKTFSKKKRILFEKYNYKGLQFKKVFSLFLLFTFTELIISIFFNKKN